MKLCALLHGHAYSGSAVFAPKFGDAELAVSCYSFLLSLCKPALLLGLKAPWLTGAVACLACLALGFLVGICILS